MRFIIALVFAALFSLPGLAEEVTPGSFIQPKGALPLRGTPPSGLTGDKGVSIGTATADAKYQVLERKTFSTVSGGETWLHVQDVNNPKNAGWIFSGTKDQPFANVTVAR